MKLNLDNYFEFKKEKTVKDVILYMSLAFRPLSKLLFCFILTVMFSFVCVIVMQNSEGDESIFDIAFAILTGVVASGLVSLVICLLDNFTHNYKRLLVLHEYFFVVVDYENFDSFFQECLKGLDSSQMGLIRNNYNWELVLKCGPIIESAYNDGREYMSLAELGYVKSQIELYHIIRERQSDLDNMDTSKQDDLQRMLETFDLNMDKLKSFIRFEPRYNMELISVNARFEKYRQQINKQIDKDHRKVILRLKKAVKEKRISESEYEEFLKINDEVNRNDDYEYSYEQLRRKKRREYYILAKAAGISEEELASIHKYLDE